jgi:undecaprenyl diphosphate synthase
MTHAGSHPGSALRAEVTEKLTDAEEAVLLQISPSELPRHVAIIMDGNGRWARQHGFMQRIRGHEAGIDSVRIAVRTCGELHLRALTLYAFSVENWQRPKTEVMALMALLEKFLRDEIPELNANNVRLVASGCLEDLPAKARVQLDGTMDATAGNNGLVLNLALSYGGRTEITAAVRHLARSVSKGMLRPEEIDEEMISQQLYHHELGDPDLLIRTSGELRVSNFLLWQIAYAEIYVTPVLWPDFRREHLYAAILDYQKRERRFGKVLNR